MDFQDTNFRFTFFKWINNSHSHVHKWSLNVRFWPFLPSHETGYQGWFIGDGHSYQPCPSLCKSAASANRHLDAVTSALTEHDAAAQKSSPASSLQRSQKKTSLRPKVWEGRGCGILLLSPVCSTPCLCWVNTLQWDTIRYQVVFTPRFSMQHTFFSYGYGSFSLILFPWHYLLRERNRCSWICEILFKMLHLINTDIYNIHHRDMTPFICV